MKDALVSIVLATVLFGCGKPDQRIDQTSVAVADSAETMPENQLGEDGSMPAGWNVRLDKPDPSVTIGSSDSNHVSFATMSPGWHIKTHKAAIFYDYSKVAKDRFKLTASVFLFDPEGRDREGFGLLFGGSSLESEEQSYSYFLVRNTGDFLVKKRSGSESETLVGWTPAESLNTHPGLGTESVENILGISVSAESVAFFINDINVATVPRSQLPVDGVVGLRVNHGLNLHVSDLTVTESD